MDKTQLLFSIREDVEQFTLSADDWIEKLKEKVEYCETRIQPLNKYLGGLAKGQYYVACAPTNIGKSTLLQSLAIDCLKAGKKVLFIGAEDDLTDIRIKFGLALTKTDFKKYYTNSLTDHNIEYIEQCKKDKTIPYINNLFLFRRESLEDITDVIKAFHEYHGVDYVFYDYIGSITDDTNTQEYKTLVKESDIFQTMASKYNLFVMSAVQANCNQYSGDIDKPYQFSQNDIAGAKSIANKAKVMLFMYEDKKSSSIVMNIWKAKRWLEFPTIKDRTFEVKVDANKCEVRSVDIFEKL